MDFKVAEARHIESIVEVWKELSALHADLDDESFGIVGDAEDIFREYLAQAMEGEDFLTVVALSGEDVAGYVTARVTWHPPLFRVMPRGEILDLAVKEGFRRQGAGRGLVSAVCGWLEDRDVSRVEMMVATGNVNGMAFWESEGFEPYLVRMHRETGRR